MLEVDETFTTIWFQGQPRSGSWSGDDLSPLLGLFWSLSMTFYLHELWQIILFFRLLYCTTVQSTQPSHAKHCGKTTQSTGRMWKIAFSVNIVASLHSLVNVVSRLHTEMVAHTVAVPDFPARGGGNVPRLGEQRQCVPARGHISHKIEKVLVYCSLGQFLFWIMKNQLRVSSEAQSLKGQDLGWGTQK